jgi:two-component system, chemotaxis family, chemotaxis protein CheY
MKTLIVEDDSVSASLLRTILSAHSECDVAEDGEKAVALFKRGREGKPYDLVCLDIMLPGKDGQSVLRDIRAIEAEAGVPAPDGVKIIMITALGDKENVMGAFRSQAEAYIVKPIRKGKVIAELKELGLVG